MRGYVGGQHAGVSVGIPGPKAAVGLIGFIVMLPVWIIWIVVQGVLAVILLAVLIGKIVVFLARIAGALLLVVTFPIWGPVYWLWPSKPKTPSGGPLPPPEIPRFGGPPRGLGDR